MEQIKTAPTVRTEKGVRTHNPGLTSREAAERLRTTGRNIIMGRRGPGTMGILIHQFRSPLMVLLAAAAALSCFLGEWLDGSAIMIVMVVNAIIGFWMEYQAEHSMYALKKLVSMPAKVIRDGRLYEVPSEQIVPGDLLFVEAGDLIVADAHIIETAELQADEAVLTGESLPVTKRAGDLPASTPLSERTNALFKGTYVTRGIGYAVVQRTGMRTELGKIATLVSGARVSASPLEKKLRNFSRRLIWITVGLLAAVVLVGIFHRMDVIELIKTAIALAVAAIPEGLPIVATLALARGMLKLAKHRVIIKRLAAVETLGGTDIICTDKTGTLTQNQIEVNIVLCPDHTTDSHGHVRSYRPEDVHTVNDELRMLMEIAVLCSSAESIHTDEGYTYIGDPIETGLLRFAAHAGFRSDILRADRPMAAQVPFSSESRLMLTMHQKGAAYWVAAKGALEEILAGCTAVMRAGRHIPLTDRERDQWLRYGEDLATRGLRVLGFAWKSATTQEEITASDLVFTGIVGFLDPPMQGVREALEQCREAGIEVKMITGDHPATAATIGRTLGLMDADDTRVILGKDMRHAKHLTIAERQRWVETKLFARVSPAQKLDLITALQEEGHIVAMTGDGINDAPALKKADIGIAMGKRGTQVAQEVATMILKDDAFASIVLAIRQGRVIFENIRKFVVYLLSGNLSELMAVATAASLNLHFQLLPLQILFINLISDVLPALSLGMSRGSAEVMKHPPRNPGEPIINQRKWTAIWIYAGVIAACTLTGVWVHHEILNPDAPWDPQASNNILFLTLIGAQLLHVFNMDSGNHFLRAEEFGNLFV
jgi:Ca2+-transporting ATPase